MLVKNALCILLILSVLLLSACCYNLEESDLSMDNPKHFETVSDMRGFYTINRFKFGGGFLCLDLEGEDEFYIEGYNRKPKHIFRCSSVADNKYVSPMFSSEYRIYSEKLGTDTETGYDVPYHSITMCFVSTVYSNPFRILRYEFGIPESEPWDHVVRIYSGNERIAEMYYSTGLNIEQEWIEDFLSEYIVKVFW